MTDVNAVTQNATAEDTSDVSFSPEQQVKVNEIVAAERRKAQATIEGLRADFQKLMGVEDSTDTTGDLVNAKRAQMQRDQERLELLKATYFGNAAGCGLRASELKRINPAAYKALKAEYHALLGVRPYTAGPTLGFHDPNRLMNKPPSK